MDLRKLQRVIVDALDDIKGQDIQVFNTTGQTDLFDRVIVATATSNRQTRALAAHVRDKVKEAGGQVISVEGEESGEWVLVDLGDAVVHIMQPAIRAYYRLEELWGAKPVSLKIGPKKRPAARGARGSAAKRAAPSAPSAPSAAAAPAEVDSAPARRPRATKSAAPSKSAAPAKPAARATKSAAPAKPAARATKSAAPAKPAARATKSAAPAKPAARATRSATTRAGKRTGNT